MALQAELARVREQYAEQTQIRMDSFAEELKAAAQKQGSCTDALWSQLREQEEASRHAGFAGISRLCREMQLCLEDVQQGGQAQLPAVADAMLSVCQSIRSHATNAEKRSGEFSLCGCPKTTCGAGVSPALTVAPVAPQNFETVLGQPLGSR